eukprot:2306967-Prymnesium_polylepis.2
MSVAVMCRAPANASARDGSAEQPAPSSMQRVVASSCTPSDRKASASASTSAIASSTPAVHTRAPVPNPDMRPPPGCLTRSDRPPRAQS